MDDDQKIQKLQMLVHLAEGALAGGLKQGKEGHEGWEYSADAVALRAARIAITTYEILEGVVQ